MRPSIRPDRGASSTWNPARILASLLLVAGILASFLAMIAPASAQATASVASYIPATALFSAEFELDTDSDQVMLGAELLERANLSALLEEEDMQGLEDGLTALNLLASGEAAVFLTELPVEEDFTLDDVTSDAADITMDPESSLGGDIPQGWAVVVMPDDAESSFDLYSSIVFGDETATLEETEYNGYTITSQEAADEFSQGAAIALVDDVIALATVPEDLEPVIDAATGDVEPLADSASYLDVRGALETEVLNFGYVNGPALLDEIVAQDPDAAASLPEDLTVSFGAHQGYVFWADDPGFRLDTIALPAEGADIPAAESFEPAFTQNVPDTSLIYFGGSNLGENASLNALAVLFAQGIVGEDMFAAATPVADPEAYADEIFAEAEGLLGFNLKTDLLDQFVGEWAVAGSVANISSLEPEFSAVFVTEVDDDETVAGVTETITNLIATQMINADEEGSFTLETSDGITVIDASESGFPLVVEFGVVDGSLVIGVNQGIEDFAGGATDALADDATFQETFDALPTDVTSMAYLNVQGLLPLIEDAIAMSSSSSLLDNDPACGEFATQEEAQAAYDEDDFENFSLDLDWDGEACEDYFAPASPEAVPASGISDVNVLSVGTVTFNDGETMGSSTLILIGE